MKHINHPFAHCVRRSDETIVQPGLAVTPAQALVLAEKGLPVSAHMNSQMIDGHTHSDWNVPLEEQRGIDIAQMWQESRNIRRKFENAHNSGQVVTENSQL